VDLAVAASILLCAGLLTLTGIAQLRLRHDRLACENNLRVIGTALLHYSDHEPDGAFPDISQAFVSAHVDNRAHAEVQPVAAGLFMPMLVDGGLLLPEQANVCCPAVGKPTSLAWDLAALRQMSAEEFHIHARDLVPSYAYTLGYRDEQGRLHGLRRADGTMPIAADQPPPSIESGNSPNHGGLGQNVLFTDGHVDWFTGRVADGDDFFINREHHMAAGLGRLDYVLGPSDSHP
jgi:prepilin-type processing-associated H-X9-DG protein